MNLSKLNGSNDIVISFIFATSPIKEYDAYFQEFLNHKPEKLHVVYLYDCNSVMHKVFSETYNNVLFSKVSALYSVYDVIRKISKVYKGVDVFNINNKNKNTIERFCNDVGIISCNVGFCRSTQSNNILSKHNDLSISIQNKEYSRYKSFLSNNITKENAALFYNNFYPTYNIDLYMERIVECIMKNKYSLFESRTNINGIKISDSMYNLEIITTHKENSLKYDIDRNKVIMNIAEGNNIIDNISKNRKFIKEMITIYLEKYKCD